MLINPEISDCSIVMVGEFNPAIFHPAWLKANKIENDVSDEVTQVDIVHGDIAMFRIDTRYYKIENNRFSLEVTTAPWVHILDITRQIFGDFLSHTPIQAFGVNRRIHFPVKDIETRTEIGRKLAPIEPWGEFGQQMDELTSSGHPNGGLQSLTMRRVREENDVSILINTKIEPSARIKDNLGIFMEINNHHQLLDYKLEAGSGRAIELLCKVFEEEVQNADKIMETIMKYGK